MIFSQLYGIELDRELGTTDVSQRFTTARRKAAINAAQLEFVERTECFQRQVELALVDATQEYDLEASVTNLLVIAKQGISIKIVDSSANVRYIEGKDLVQTTIQRLNDEESGWRAVSAGTPRKWYLRQQGGVVELGFHPKPDFASGDTWTALVPCVMQPTDLTLDADVPFTYSSDAIISLKPYHRALVHYAAYDLEKFRKDTARGAAQLQLWEDYIARYQMKQLPKAGGRVRFLRDYRGDARLGSSRSNDPRVD